MSDPAREVNCDGLVGPTHNYGGLSFGNIASLEHGGRTSNPRAAALQGLAKMKLLFARGVSQIVFPPGLAPRLDVLRRLGFTGADRDALARAHRADPALLALVYSASDMWTANAATVSPSADCRDGRVHFTIANLATEPHRSLEAGDRLRLFRKVFADETHFRVHEPLPSFFPDEGAANHTRLCPDYGEAGLHVFVYGRELSVRGTSSEAFIKGPGRFPARQCREAQESIARLHGLALDRVAYLRQNPAAIDAGVFHNDVISLGDRDFFFYHEQAFADPGAIDALQTAYKNLRAADDKPGALRLFMVPANRLSLAEAVVTYVFNSQIVRTGNGETLLLAPEECAQNAPVMEILEEAREAGCFRQMDFINLRESMNNGGGPACLRLRVALTEKEFAAVHPGVVFTDALYEALRDWVERRYRARLAPEDLQDPELIEETRDTLAELEEILDLRGAIV